MRTGKEKRDVTRGSGIPRQELLAYIETHPGRKVPLRNAYQLAYQMIFELWGKTDDTACVLFLNRGKYLISAVHFTEGSLHRLNILTKGDEMYEKHGAAYFFLGHTHGNHSLNPSPEDIRSTRYMEQYYKRRLRFLGHVITNSGIGYKYIQL